VVDAVSVGDERVGQGTQIQQLVPVGVVPGQPGDLQAQDDPGLAQADIGDQLSEPAPARGGRARAAQVIVDHHDLIPGPAQGPGPAGQIVLPVQALGMVHRLRQR
jgi:hypothetical protein